MIKTRRQRKGGMTVSEAGRKGGERVRDERGVGFYQEIGRKGGELGGERAAKPVRDKYGPSFYEEIGRKGGQKVRELIEQARNASFRCVLENRRNARGPTPGGSQRRRGGGSFQPPEAGKWQRKRRAE